jgi:hypothetical protein
MKPTQPWALPLIACLLTLSQFAHGLDKAPDFVGKDMAAQKWSSKKVIHSKAGVELVEAFGAVGKRYLLAYSKKDQKILDALSVSDPTLNIYGSRNCSDVGAAPVVGIGVFDETGKMEKTAGLMFDTHQGSFKDLADLSQLNCKLHCKSAPDTFYRYCQWQLPCSKQNESDLSPKCVKERCPLATKSPRGVTVVGLLRDGSVFGVVGIDKKSRTFSKLQPQAISAFNEIYDAEAKQTRKLTVTAAFDGIESDRCYYSYDIEGLKGTKGMGLIVGPASTEYSGAVHGPTAEETAIFSKTHKMCEKTDCGDVDDWNKNTLIAVTDLNQNGKSEYWFQFADGFRWWYRAEEYNAQTKTWTEVYSF